MKKTIAITGSSGFIGKHLVNHIKKSDYNLIELDIQNGVDLSRRQEASTIPSFNIVIHLAAKSFVPESFENPHDFYWVNINSTLNILELARKNNAKVIFLSSYLYGKPQYLPIDEKHPLAPHNPYAQSKLICEKLCEGYQRDFHVPIVVFRPFNIYGPGQNNIFLIPRIIEQLKNNEIVMKDPRPKRDYIYVSDIVHALLLAIEYNGHLGLEIYNLGTGRSYSVEEVTGYLSSIAGVKPKLIFTNEYRQGEVLDTVADISKVYAKFGWKPEVDLQKGLFLVLKG